jgi:hypothetical protein
MRTFAVSAVMTLQFGSLVGGALSKCRCFEPDLHHSTVPYLKSFSETTDGSHHEDNTNWCIVACSSLVTTIMCGIASSHFKSNDAASHIHRYGNIHGTC